MLPGSHPPLISIIWSGFTLLNGFSKIMIPQLHLQSTFVWQQLQVRSLTHLALLDDLILEEEVQHSREFAHREPVIGWKVTHVPAVVNYGKSAGFRSHLPGGEDSWKGQWVLSTKFLRRFGETLATSRCPRGDLTSSARKRLQELNDAASPCGKASFLRCLLANVCVTQAVCLTNIVPEQ